jgi:hypothetical protein
MGTCGVGSLHSPACSLMNLSTLLRMPYLSSCSRSPPSFSHFWSTITFSSSTCHYTPSRWWRSSCTSVRCMYVCVRPSVHLFRCLHVLRSSRRKSIPLGRYYFQHQTKGPSVYITALSPSKWDHWRENWVIVQADAQDRQVLPTAAPIAHRSD